MGEGRVKPSSMTEIFKKAFPQYLSIGMTYDQFWHGEPELVKYFRDAQKMRESRENYNMWMQGAYIYNAIISVASQVYADKGKKGHPYMEHPIPLTKEEMEYYDMLEQKKRFEELKSNIERWALGEAARIKAKEAYDDGDDRHITD